MSGFTYTIALETKGFSALDKVMNTLDRLDKLAGKFQNSGVEALEKVERAAKKSSGAMSRLGDMAGSVWGRVAAIGAGAGLLKMTSDAEQTSVAFQTMIGDVGRARDLIESLNKFANVTPFSQSEVMDGGKRLLSAGFSDAEIPKYLQLIGDVASGAKLPLGELSSIFSKFKTKGIIQSNEIDLLADRGVPIISALSKTMGVAESSVYKMASQSKIHFGDMVTAFESMTGPSGLYFEMMQKQSETLGGKWSTLLGTAEQVAVGFVSRLTPAFISVMNYAIPLVEWIGRNADAFAFAASVGAIWWGTLKMATFWQTIYTGATRAAAFGQMLFSGSLGAGIAISTLSTAVTGGLTGAVSALNVAFWANPIMWVVGILATLAAGVMYAWNKFEGFRGFVFGMFEGLKAFGRHLFEYIVLPFKTIGTVVGGIFSGDFDMIKRGLSMPLSFAQSLGSDVSQSFTKGWNSGVANEYRFDPLGSIAGMKTPSAIEKAFGPDDKTQKTLGGGGDQKQLGAGIAGVAAGGSKNITINFSGKMVESFTVQTTNLREGIGELRDLITKELFQVLNTANQAQ